MRESEMLGDEIACEDADETENQGGEDSALVVAGDYLCGSADYEGQNQVKENPHKMARHATFILPHIAARRFRDLFLKERGFGAP